MAVLVDTSIWIKFLANTEPYATGLDELLSTGEIIGHEMIFGELLIGDPGGRRSLLANYEKIRQATVLGHRDVVEFVRVRNIYGLGVGWIDAHLLASSVVDGVAFWTADPTPEGSKRVAGGRRPPEPAKPDPDPGRRSNNSAFD